MTRTRAESRAPRRAHPQCVARRATPFAAAASLTETAVPAGTAAPHVAGEDA